MRTSKYLRGAAVLTAGSLLAKVVGAFYRIPLTNLLGGYGTGLYQMAYPLFCLFLTLSSTGVPVALSRVIARETARGEEDGATAKVALRLFALLGAAGTAMMLLLAPAMSALQGERNLLACYAMLAPAVFFVALLSVFRGYFQGRGEMAPTAVSELVEQLVKAGCGLLFAYRYASDPARAAALTLLAVAISEVVACAVMALRFKGATHVRRRRLKKPAARDLWEAVLPVMAAACILPLSHTADSVLLVRLLRGTQSAVAQYGLFAGAATSLVSLASTACYGLGAGAVPAVSEACARGEEGEAKKRAAEALLFTLLLSLPCALVLLFFARPIVELLFPALERGDAMLLCRLVRVSSVSAALLAATDTLAACLAGMGRAKYAARSMLVAVSVKFFLEVLLVGDPRLGILGAAIASDACYLIAFLLDLRYTVKKHKEGKIYDHSRRYGDAARRTDVRGQTRAHGGGRGARAHGGSRLDSHA